LLQVLNDHALGTKSEGLLLDLLKILGLPNVGKERDNGVALKSEPCEDRGCVEAYAMLELRIALAVNGVNWVWRHTARVGAVERLLAWFGN
jgi:hypothetical protein